MDNFMEIVTSDKNKKNDKKRDYLTLKEFFNNRQYCIPSYQRMYEWTDKNVSEMWEDLVDTYHNLEQGEKYFMGVTFLTQGFNSKELKSDHHCANTTNRVSLSDGQQRTTSFMLLFAAIRNKLKLKLKEKGLEQIVFTNINETITKLEEMMFIDRKLRVLPITNDCKLQDKFNETINIEGDESIDNYKVSVNNDEITNTVNRFKLNYIKLYENLTIEFGDDFNEILEFTDYVMESIVLILIELNKNKTLNTRKFFNRLNSRGKKLDDVTEIRNNMFMKYVNEDTEYDENWFNGRWVNIFNNFSNEHAVKIIGLHSASENIYKNQQSYISVFKEDKVNKDKLLKKITNGDFSEKDLESISDLKNINIWSQSIKYRPHDFEVFYNSLNIRKSHDNSSKKLEELEFNLKIFMALTHHELWIILRKSVIELISNADKSEYHDINSTMTGLNKLIKKYYILTDGKSPVTKYDVEMKVSVDEIQYEVSTAKMGQIYDKLIYTYYKNIKNGNACMEDIEKAIKNIWMNNLTYSIIEEQTIIRKAETFPLKAEYDGLKKYSFLPALLISDESDKMIKSLSVGYWDVDHILDKKNFKTQIKQCFEEDEEVNINFAFNLHPLPNSENRKYTDEDDDETQRVNYYRKKLRYVDGQEANHYTHIISELMDKYVTNSKIDLKEWKEKSCQAMTKQLLSCIDFN